MVKIHPAWAMAWERYKRHWTWPRETGPHTMAFGATAVSKHRPHVEATLKMICAPESDYVWRVHIKSDTSVEVKYIGYNPIDGKRSTVYATFDMIPDWMQGRIAVLRMMPPDPQESVVFGVGRRVSEDVYWVVQ